MSIDAIDANEDAFKDLDILAKSAVVYDAGADKIIFEKNADAKLPLASITKVFMGLLVLQNLDPGSTLTITQEDLMTEGYSPFSAGDTWRVGELLKYALVVSSNDGISALGRVLKERTGRDLKSLFFDLTEQLSLERSVFLNPSGLDEGRYLSGAYGSAKDVVKGAMYAVRNFPGFFEVTTKTQANFFDEMGNAYDAKNTNQYINKIFASGLSKTGFTDLAGGNLVVVFEIEPGRDIVLVVLGSTKEGRFSDIQKLHDATLRYFDK